MPPRKRKQTEKNTDKKADDGQAKPVVPTKRTTLQPGLTSAQIYPLASRLQPRKFEQWTLKEKYEVENFLAMRTGVILGVDHTTPAANWLLREFERLVASDPMLALRLDPFQLFVDDLNQGAGGVPAAAIWAADLDYVEGVIAITLNAAAVAPAGGWQAGAAGSIVQFVNGRNDRLVFATDLQRQIAAATIAGRYPQALFLKFNTNALLESVQYP